MAKAHQQIQKEQWKNVSPLPLHQLKFQTYSHPNYTIFTRRSSPKKIFFLLTGKVWGMIEDQTNTYLKNRQKKEELKSNGYVPVDPSTLQQYFAIRTACSLLRKNTIQECYQARF